MMPLLLMPNLHFSATLLIPDTGSFLVLFNQKLSFQKLNSTVPQFYIKIQKSLVIP